MSLKCNNIEALRLALKNNCEEEKPNGQVKHQLKNCVVNTYNTGSVVVQDNNQEKSIQKQIEDLVNAINVLEITICDKK